MNIYDSIVDSIQELDAATRGEIYTAVIEYLRFEREPDLEAMSQIARVLFMSFKPNLENQVAQSKRAKKPRPGSRKKGMEPNASQDSAVSYPNASRNLTESYPNASRSLAESYPNANEQEQEQEIEKPSASAEGKKRASRFVPPTPGEVDAYIAEKGFTGFTGQQFVDHYEANGWMRGKSKVRDWKACVRTWATRERGPSRARAAPLVSLTDWGAYELPVEEA